MSSAEKPTDEATASASSSSAAKQPTAVEEEEEKIVLRSSDGEDFAAGESIARKCGMIGNMIDDECVDGPLVLPNIRSRVLSRVLEFIGRKSDKEFEVEFFNKLADREALFDVILAANYLDAQELLAASCTCAADRIRGLTVQQIRDYLDIKND